MVGRKVLLLAAVAGVASEAAAATLTDCRTVLPVVGAVIDTVVGVGPLEPSVAAIPAFAPFTQLNASP